MDSRGQLYAGAVGKAALQGLVTTIWLASEELPVSKRRLTRAGMMLGIALERRWLEQLFRRGQPHPQRVVALRIGFGSLVATMGTARATPDRPWPLTQP